MRRGYWIIRTSLWALLLAGCAAAVAAQPIPVHPRELTFDPIEFDPPDASAHRHVMSNGVVAFVVPDHTLPLVTVSVLVRTGRYLEPTGKAGLAELTGSQMRAGGTTSLTAAAFDDEAAFLAAQISSAIGDTRGRASVSCLTKDLDAVLDLFFDMLRNPRFRSGSARSCQQPGAPAHRTAKRPYADHREARVEPVAPWQRSLHNKADNEGFVGSDYQRRSRCVPP